MEKLKQHPERVSNVKGKLHFYQFIFGNKMTHTSEPAKALKCR